MKQNREIKHKILWNEISLFWLEERVEIVDDLIVDCYLKRIWLYLDSGEDQQVYSTVQAAHCTPLYTTVHAKSVIATDCSVRQAAGSQLENIINSDIINQQ